jgi:hypothetical protein
MRQTIGIRIVLAVVLIAGLGSLCAAQQDSKEMRTMKLRLKEARLALEQAEADLAKADARYKEARSLFEKGLYSKLELAQTEDMYNMAALAREQAAINLEKTRLAFLSDALHVTLLKAALYRDANGQKHALLTIRNNSNIGRVIDEEGAYSGKEKRALLTIENLAVRIRHEGNLIGRPFEAKIASLRYGQVRNIDFMLQRETEAVTVELAYADTTVYLPVFLEKEAKEDRVQVEAVQFSLEGELGTRVSYELELERFVDDNKTFTLDILNLPPDYTYEFHESATEGEGRERRVSRIRFKKGITAKTIKLYINMPKEIDKELLNTKFTFFVLVLDRFATERLGTLKAKSQGRALQGEDLDSGGISYETLELIPRGRAEVTISASSLFHKAALGDMITFSFNLHNTGTVNLDRIRVYLGLPIDWTANVNPEKNISLEVEQKQRVDVEVIPAVDVVASDYEIKVEARTLHEGREVEAPHKIMRIQVEGKSNFVIGAILMIVLIGMVVGVAVMTIKISRR